MATRATEAELIELEKRYWEAVKRKDVETIAKLTDDACLVTGPRGAARLDGETVAALMNSTPATLRDFSLTGATQVRLLGTDIGIVAYTVHEELTVEGRPLALDVADTSTWVRRDDGWVCVQHSEAIAGDPFGRDRTGEAAVAGRALQADALLDRIETATGALPDRDGRSAPLVKDILQAVNGLRSLLGVVESH